MKTAILLATVTAAVFASSAAAATTFPGYYWGTARMTAAAKLNVWTVYASSGSGLRCDDQGRGACNYTVSCRGQAANPTATPATRDVLKVGGRYRFRFFHCVTVSPCLLGGSWWQDYRTTGDGPASLTYDVRHIRPNGGPELRASAGGCG